MFFRKTYAKLAAISFGMEALYQNQSQLNKELRQMAKWTNELRDEVSQMKGAVASATALIEGFAKRIEDANSQGSDEVAAVISDIRAQRRQLADAVAMNDEDPNTNPERDPSITPVGTPQNPEPTANAGNDSIPTGEPFTPAEGPTEQPAPAETPEDNSPNTPPRENNG